MSANNRPRFRLGIHPHVARHDLVVFLTEAGIEPLRGRLFATLAPLIDGNSTVPEIIAKVEGTLDTFDVIHGVDELRRMGYVADSERNEKTVAVCSVDAVPRNHDADCLIVITNDYLRPELESVEGTWMPVRPFGDVVWIGPLFEPGRGPSFQSLVARLRNVRDAWGVPDSVQMPAGELAPIALSLAGQLVQNGGESRLLTFDLRTLKLTAHCFGEECRAPDDHVSPLTGIVHSVERVQTKKPSPVSVYTAQHNFRIRDGEQPLRSIGKGFVDADARTGALCEALERYSGIWRGDERVKRASFRKLGDAAVHPNACSLDDEPFDEDANIDWVAARSLTNGGKRYVAAWYCFYGHPEGFADSNGNAAGRTRDEAMLHGLLELIERDAVGIWWYNRVRRPAVQLREFNNVQLLDVTNDLGIPVFVAVSDGYLGFGANPDPAVAARRAIAEMEQVRALNGPKHDLGSFGKPLSVKGRAYKAPETLAGIVAMLKKKGMETLAVDLTRNDAGLPVVKMIVPGLRHFRPRFAPGRLYDVPVKLGWRKRPVRRDELNPEHLRI